MSNSSSFTMGSWRTKITCWKKDLKLDLLKIRIYLIVTRYGPNRPAADTEGNGEFEFWVIFEDFWRVFEDFLRIFEEYWRIFEDFWRIFEEFWKF